MKRYKAIACTGLLILTATYLAAQPRIIDRVVAVVGDNMILQSDVENLYLQYRAQGMPVSADNKCVILEEFLSQKLLLNQAKIDSIEVTESQVELSLDNRLQYFINQIGSQEKLEAYFNKTIFQIKDDFRDLIRDQMITNEMQTEITGSVAVTPSEVRQFYNNFPKDSIPYIDAQTEISQIVIYPPVTEDAIFNVKQRLLELRKRIIDGDSFTTLAVLYSEDGSATRGGEVGFKGKGELDSEYAKAAFSLKKDGISTIVESDFGYHIIQLIERQDDRVNTRHILMKAKIEPDAVVKTTSRLDSLATVIRTDTLTFATAARYFSQDKHTSVNGGIRINPYTNTTQFEMDELNPEDYYAIKDLEVGEITRAFQSTDENGKQVYKIIRVNSRTKPHRANLKDDYMTLQALALVEKKEQVFQDWIQEKILSTYIRIDDSFKSCTFAHEDWVR